MHPLEKLKQMSGKGLVDFCKNLDIHHETYRKIITGNVLNMSLNAFIKIEKNTGLSFEKLVDVRKIFKIIQEDKTKKEEFKIKN